VAFLAMLAGASPVKIAPGEAKQPQVAVSADGAVYVAYGVGNAVKVARSPDGGRVFEAPATVGEVGALALGMRRGPRIAATGKSVVVTAVGGAIGKGKDGDVLSWRSSDAGATWSGPLRVNTVEGSAREGLQGLAAGPEGRVFCAWLDLRNNRTEIFGAASRDGGKTWQADKLVYRSPERSVCECCHPAVAFAADGTLYVMWRNQLRGNRDMYLIASKDGGATFGKAAKLGRESWALNQCPMDGGAVAAMPDGSAATVWMRNGSVLATSAKNAERPLGTGVQPWCASGSGGLFTVWLKSRPGALMLLSPGAEQPVRLADAANDPVIASGRSPRGPVFAAWEQPGAGILGERLDTAAK
jgi:hypothetical protein